ncbi:MAG: UDP-2,3-diacetamido-2,3-dideoxy-D-glucuronate 2-epimerase [Bacteroidia bacterium]|nr:UDP-2,3-diacetamido-2,3-dideoxy-D-glucuronate 2-epimerase [Bacteroidia bacterium]
MLKIFTIVGARPQIIKAAAISRQVRTIFKGKIEEVIIHTGQHYDENMSQVFFDEMEIPKPDFNLNIGSGTHGSQTAKMIEGIEKLLLEHKPDALIIYGDTNSTLAGAIAASKIHIPVVHIEAGLRSYNKAMPEEINRILADHVSTLLFSPTKTGYTNLLREGFEDTEKSGRTKFDKDHPGIFHCGDVMYDNTLFFAEMAEKKSAALQQNNLTAGNFVLVTIHRPSNTDNQARLTPILEALNEITNEQNVEMILPLHPRTLKMLGNAEYTGIYEALKKNNRIKIIPPASFFDMIVLGKNAKLIITDSGGVQKEAYFFKKPSIVLRPETEWKEIVENGTAIIADADKQKIKSAYHYFSLKNDMSFPEVFGDGKAAEFICKKMLELL